MTNIYNSSKVGISDIFVAYVAKLEGYTTFLSHISYLSAIAKKDGLRKVWKFIYI